MTTRRTACGTLLYLVITLTGCSQEAEPPSPSDVLVIESATLIDGRTGETRSGVTILVEDDRIADVGPEGEMPVPDGARRIDAVGKWVMPGIVDVHTHLTEDAADGHRRFLAAGVTTVHAMPAGIAPADPGPWEERAWRAETPSPRVQVTPAFSGEFPDNVFPGVYELRKPAIADEARAAVREVHERGYGQIKIIQDDGSPFLGTAVRDFEPEVFDALVDEAKSAGMRVYVHATQIADTRLAVDAGAHAFMHGTMDELVSGDLWTAMRDAGTVWTPAFRVLVGAGDSRDFDRRLTADSALHRLLSADRLEAARASAAPVNVEGFEHLHDNLEDFMKTLGANTRAAVASGIPVAVGSDGGPDGVGTHVEMELMQESGLEPAGVIVAATSGGARALGMSEEIGAIEPGMFADVVILDADPTVDIRNARLVTAVVKGGHVWTPRELLEIP